MPNELLDKIPLAYIQEIWGGGLSEHPLDGFQPTQTFLNYRLILNMA